VSVNHGPGTLHEGPTPAPDWGGRRAQQYVQATLSTYGDICIICGLPGADSADHVIPRAEGGAVYDLDNLGPAHRRCNYARGKRALRVVGIPIESGLAHFH